MELEGSLQCSQKPTTGPYSEPVHPVHTFLPFLEGQF
jgi:hypothetical protein